MCEPGCVFDRRMISFHCVHLGIIVGLGLGKVSKRLLGSTLLPHSGE